MKYIRCKQGGVIVRKHDRQFRFDGGICEVSNDFAENLLKNELFEEITETEYHEIKDKIPKSVKEEEKPKQRKKGSKAFMKLEDD